MCFLQTCFPLSTVLQSPRKKISQNASEMGRKRSFSDVQHVWNICSILSHHYQQGARETGHRTTIASATHWESYAGGGGEAQEEVRCWEVRCWGKNGEKIWKSSLRGPKNAWVSSGTKAFNHPNTFMSFWRHNFEVYHTYCTWWSWYGRTPHTVHDI